MSFFFVVLFRMATYSFVDNFFKGTVSVISSDPPCKDSNARFTTVPLQIGHCHLYMEGHLKLRSKSLYETTFLTTFILIDEYKCFQYWNRRFNLYIWEKLNIINVVFYLMFLYGFINTKKLIRLFIMLFDIKFSWFI